MEIEAKIALDAAELTRLQALLGAPKRTVQQRDMYFATGDKPVALRVREDGDQAWVTLKAGFEKRDGIRMREEFEPAIRPEDLGLWETVFDRLGFPPLEEVKKTREEFEREGVHVVLDHVEGLGDFIEVEVVGEDPDDAKDRLEAAMGAIGVAHLPRILESYRDLLRARRQP